MYRTIDDFLTDWAAESANTARIMEALTDASMAQRVTPDDRSLGWTAWHIVTALAEMPSHMGLELRSIQADATVPVTAQAVGDTYKCAASELADLIAETWADETLAIVDEMYGQHWARGLTLQILLRHEIHHRAQMTVLMRQAGLRVPGVYGPSKEEMTEMGMTPPAV